MEYIVAGYTMINDIIFADGSSIKDQLGGSIFSAAGIKLWRDSLVYIGTAGPDFKKYYGDFFQSNKIHTAVEEVLEHTLYYVLEYNKDGSWQEYCKYGEEYENEARDIGKLTPEMFERYCDESTKGIYLEAGLNTDIVNHFSKLRSMMPKGKLMWEISTDDLEDPDKHDTILRLIDEVDIFSVNLKETKAFFQVNTDEEAIEEILKLNKACFLRAGTKGSYLIDDGQVTFLPSYGVEESVDATGCGNCSTATALIGFAEGLPALETLAMANISAGYNARQYGPWPLVDEKVRKEARTILANIIRHSEA